MLNKVINVDFYVDVYVFEVCQRLSFSICMHSVILNFRTTKCEAPSWPEFFYFAVFAFWVWFEECFLQSKDQWWVLSGKKDTLKCAHRIWKVKGEIFPSTSISWLLFFSLNQLSTGNYLARRSKAPFRALWKENHFAVPIFSSLSIFFAVEGWYEFLEGLPDDCRQSSGPKASSFNRPGSTPNSRTHAGGGLSAHVRNSGLVIPKKCAYEKNLLFSTSDLPPFLIKSIELELFKIFK